MEKEKPVSEEEASNDLRDLLSSLKGQDPSLKALLPFSLLVMADRAVTGESSDVSPSFRIKEGYVKAVGIHEIPDDVHKANPDLKHGDTDRFYQVSDGFKTWFFGSDGEQLNEPRSF